MDRKNCWEVKGCGRESGGSQVGSLGVCPAALPDRFDGVNRGERGGRFCWAIAGTFCSRKVRGTFATKLLNCLDCGFLQQVRDEEGDHFLLTPGDTEQDFVRAKDTVLRRTAAIAKRVLVFMAKNDIPLTPANYTVWFEHHYGGHEELERDVKEHKMRGTPLNAELTERLYNRYFGDQDRQRIVELVEEQSGKILKEIIESVLLTAGDTTEYGKKLRRYSRMLSGVESSQDVKRIVKHIISDTKAMEESNAGLRRRLENIAEKKLKLKNSGNPIESLGISLGVSQIRAGDGIESVLKRADESLALSKRTKQGCVKSEKDLHAE